MNNLKSNSGILPPYITFFANSYVDLKEEPEKIIKLFQSYDELLQKDFPKKY